MRFANALFVIDDILRIRFTTNNRIFVFENSGKMRFDFNGAISRGHRTTSFWFMTLFLTISNRVIAQDGESLASSFFSGKYSIFHFNSFFFGTLKRRINYYFIAGFIAEVKK